MIDGKSLVPILNGVKNALPERDLFYVRREGGNKYQGQDYYGMHRGPWKLLHNTPFQPLELYNLADDPQEENNLVQDERKVFRDMAAALRDHIQEGGRVPWQPPVDDTSPDLR